MEISCNVNSMPSHDRAVGMDIFQNISSVFSVDKSDYTSAHRHDNPGKPGDYWPARMRNMPRFSDRSGRKYDIGDDPLSGNYRESINQKASFRKRSKS